MSAAHFVSARALRERGLSLLDLELVICAVVGRAPRLAAAPGGWWVLL